jgi:hypothetical protein
MITHWILDLHNAWQNPKTKKRIAIAILAIFLLGGLIAIPQSEKQIKKIKIVPITIHAKDRDWVVYEKK